MSFIRNVHVNHIKRTAPQVKANLEQYATEYCSSSDGSTTCVLTLAKEANYPPYLFARLLVEQITNLAKSDLGAAVASPAQYLVDPTILKPQYRSLSEQNTQAMMARLAQQVHKAVTRDPLCGPRHDVARRMVGVEFEVVLEQQLSALGRSCVRVCVNEGCRPALVLIASCPFYLYTQVFHLKQRPICGPVDPHGLLMCYSAHP